MIIIIDKNQQVQFYSRSLNALPEMQADGLYHITDTLAISDKIVYAVVTVESLPDDIDSKPYFYSVTRGLYQLDETNVYGVPDEVYHQIIDDYTLELVGGVVNE